MQMNNSKVPNESARRQRHAACPGAAMNQKPVSGARFACPRSQEHEDYERRSRELLKKHQQLLQEPGRLSAILTLRHVSE